MIFSIQQDARQTIKQTTMKHNRIDSHFSIFLRKDFFLGIELLLIGTKLCNIDDVCNT